MSILWILLIDPWAVVRAIFDDGRWLWDHINGEEEEDNDGRGTD